MKHPARSVCLAVIMLVAATVFAQGPRDTGPTGLIISYQCPPAKRSALRAYMQKTGIARFAQWKQQGILKDYRLLFNRYVDAQAWDMLAVLSFRTFADVDRWRNVERQTPAGLTEDALALTSSISTDPVDLVRHNAQPNHAKDGKSVFFVIPYDYEPNPTDEYVKYVDGYVLPQVEGWMSEGILAEYGIYVTRYGMLRPWSSMFVLEYRDHDGFGARESTVAKVRSKLKEDAAWKVLSDNKKKMRVEKSPIIADELLP